jgi:hypothetical protein
MGDRDRQKPFREMWPSKTAALIAVPAIAAGIAATGGAAATHHVPFYPLAAYSSSSAGAAAPDREDPDHTDPGGEFTRIETSATISTASVSFNILGLSD